MRPLRTGVSRLVRLFGFEGLLLAVFVAAPHLPAVWGAVQPYRQLAVGIAAAVALGIGWRFRRGRILHALVLLGAAALVPVLPAATLGWLLAALLVPLDLALLGLLPDRGLLSRGGMVRSGVLGAQAVGVLALALARPGAPIPAALPIAPATAVWIVCGVSMLALLVRATFGGGAPARGMAWATAAVAAAWAGLDGGALWLLAGGAAALAAAGVEDAYALAFRDGLTGLPSRRALDEALERLSGRYALAMVDVDRFKSINDRFGHDVGDQVLKMVAKKLRSTGGGAVAYRYGGEEFALLFRGRTLVEARQWAEGARRKVEDAVFVLRDPNRPRKRPKGARGKGPTKKRLKVTVSIGVADRANGPSPLVVAKAADTALYRAKERGRNRVMVA